jgi:DNA-binding response OmpR family regulator
MASGKRTDASEAGTGATILIAEDEPRIALFLTKGLRGEGYRVAHVSDGAEVVGRLQELHPDLLLLDLGLPGIDGLTVLQRVRELGMHLPVIVLTARAELSDQIAGLDGGANDYLCKPFRFDELLARIRAHIRTAQLAVAPPTETHAEWLMAPGHGLRLNRRNREVWAHPGSAPVELTSREFLLLELFLRHPGQVLSRELILQEVWNYNHDPGTNVVEVYVRYLRRKIGAERIETVRGEGYRLVP